MLIAPPRIHRHRYHGVLAPNAKLRDQVIALGRQQGRVEESPSGGGQPDMSAILCPHTGLEYANVRPNVQEGRGPESQLLPDQV